MNASDGWLELAEAAHLLGVHSSTLRRWADTGKIAHIRTLSGRRRFSREAIDQARQGMSRPTATRGIKTAETRLVELNRRRSISLAPHPGKWFDQLNEDQRLIFRYSGQHLLGLMMQFISRSDPAETFLEEGKRIAREYGLTCYQAGLSISQTVEAFLYFRRSIIESIQSTAGLNGPNDPDGYRIFLRTIDFFDSLLVATIESHAVLSQGG